MALRERHLETVVSWFRYHLPGVVVMDCDAPGVVWSLAAARNVGVRSASALGADVVVVCDADNFPEPGPLMEAVEECRGSGLVHLPYTEFVNGDFRWSGSVGGIYVSTPEAWWLSGGQDERFRGWGCEDHAHVLAHEALLGAPMRRHVGVLTHLPHPGSAERDPGHPEHVAAAGLLGRYRAVAGDAVGMAALVGEWR